MTKLLGRLLTADVALVPCATLDDWCARMLVASAAFDRPIDRAIAAGFAADRLGWAFVAGYHQALRRLVPALPAEQLVALAVTEDGGGHPRAMTTTMLRGDDGAWRLQGAKRFVTLGRRARVLLVVASTGTDEAGRNALRLVRVDAGLPGITLRALPETPFAPEVEHAEARFDDVRVPDDDDVLPGDGYALYVKPFRTVEDLHVVGAFVGHLIAVARRRAWPDALCEDLLATLVTVRALAGEDPSSPAVHVALAGVFRAVRGVADEVDARYADAPDDEQTRWSRDRALLSVAERVRAQRLAAAWRSLRGA